MQTAFSPSSNEFHGDIIFLLFPLSLSLFFTCLPIKQKWQIVQRVANHFFISLCVSTDIQMFVVYVYVLYSIKMMSTMNVRSCVLRVSLAVIRFIIRVL